ncbi:hypothetical protein [Paraflavitalea pollutisoli]|uniref:hypothetical protein n=1 Tax=Paraflavitalea pollutisoli TaxID=3034143 RepID=UPI0023EB8800|nr:hypothetical protein [Paraflavitalea sp. H1-2-19X]
MINTCRQTAAWLTAITLLVSCSQAPKAPSAAAIAALELRQGKLITCGPEQAALGKLSFKATVSDQQAPLFATGVKLLHSFEYEEAEKVFAALIDAEPSCYMAYWGVAMSNFHPLWAPPLPGELKKGAAAIAIARGLKAPTPREGAYLEAIAAFYDDYQQTEHRTRTARFELAMDKIQAAFPEDIEAKVLYALALDAAADPADRTYAKQKKAGVILNLLYAQYPQHPGVVHYLIHTYDVPGMAQHALVAARNYATIAASSAHALHMPSHIFTRLGMWNDCVQSNLQSVESARCYAEQAGIKGHWDEEMHGIDYLIYAYLQQGDNKAAKRQLAYLATIKEVHPANFKVAYAFAAIPARYVLENKDWAAAAILEPPTANFAWADYPWPNATVHFARALGAAHTGQLKQAEAELMILKRLHDTLSAQKDKYKAGQVAVQWYIARSWWLKGRQLNDSAIQAMQTAANMEDATEKHPVTPAEVSPAREQLGDLLLALHQPAAALTAYETSLRRNPNRFNSLYGAATAARLQGDNRLAQQYYQQLLLLNKQQPAQRPELVEASRYVQPALALRHH